MVKVRKEYPLHYDGSINLDLWLSTIKDESGIESVDRLRAACDFAWRAEQFPVVDHSVWTKGSFQTGLEMVDILARLALDEESLCAAVVYRAVREGKATLVQVKKTLGRSVATLVQGVLRMAVISGIRFESDEPILGQTEDQIEQARKMLISLVDDVRVALIKLAERTCAIRSAVDRDPVKRQALAHEIFDIYAPLAHRLGIGYLKWELEDLAFRFLQTQNYKQIAGMLNEKRVDRETFVADMIERVQRVLQSMGIEAEIQGRAKHIYSIWRKMKEKNIPFSQVYDVRAVRILVDNEDECYRVLGVVHKLWHNIPNEFDDYIATPKENGYRSLHTAVFGPQGKIMEIQIRSRAMHHEAELGVCSHWRYKGLGQVAGSDDYEKKLQWLRQLLDWQDEMGDFPGAARDLISEIGKDRIYVFTPEGHVIDLMPDATPLDFAYRVHTEVGNHCVSARVNGEVVSLRSRLSTGDRVEILTDKSAQPRREWLYSHFGYLRTSRARVQVQNWFRHRERAKNVVEGRRILQDKLIQLGVAPRDLDGFIAPLGFETMDDFFSQLGMGEISMNKALELLDGIEDLLLPKTQLPLAFESEKETQLPDIPAIRGAGEAGIGLAVCCGPISSDAIVGEVTEWDGVLVHRQDCMQLLRNKSDARLIELSWSEVEEPVTSVPIIVSAYDRSGLLFDIASILISDHINMTSINTRMDPANNTVNFLLDVDVDGLNTLVQLLEKLEQVHNVIYAKRRSG